MTVHTAEPGTGPHTGPHPGPRSSASVASTPEQVRHQQEVEELCVAAIRALCGQTDLHFRGRLLHRGDRRLPLHAPHLYPGVDEDFGSFRGAADGMALRLSLSDADLHRCLLPEGAVERALFEMLEQFRVESLVPRHLRGVLENLRHRHEHWSLAFHRSGMTETARGLLLYTVIHVCRARVTGQPVVQQTEDLLEATRAGIAPLLGDDLAALRRHRSDQRAYALHAKAVAREVASMLGTSDHSSGRSDGSGDADEPDAEDLAFPLFMDFEESTETYDAAAPGTSRVLDVERQPYRSFTTAYDQRRDIASLVRPELLRTLRDRLDRRVAHEGVNVSRLARELRATLAEPADDGWDSGQDEGRVDGRLLARLVTSPTDHRLFRTERVEPVADCVVSFLLDCSGSMKQHAEAVAVLVDVLGRALELAGVHAEVLGFTTAAWHGGRAVRDWKRAGRPRHPGRLNELSHIVFKDADTPWRLGRRGVAGMLRRDLFREGVDGEAVAWARARLQSRPEQRRVLVVVSDGSPMDGATTLANDEHYLDRHLRQEVASCVGDPDIEIVGVGVGLDLSPHYPRAQALDLSGGVSNATVREFVRLLAGGRRR
jgi:cobaltochelatase CobT